MSVRARVLGPRVLLQPLEANEQTGGGVVLPDLARDKESRGIVLQVGVPDIGETEPPIEPGAVVVYAEQGTRGYGHPRKVVIDLNEDGHAAEYIVVEYHDLLIVLEEPA